MGILVWTDCTVFLDEFDATCNANRIELAGNAEVKDKTTFCSDGWREMVGGLKSLKFTYGGFGDFAEAGLDEFEFANLAAGVVHTVSPDGADGSVAYSFVGVKSAYRQTVQIGEIHGVEGTAQNARDGAVRSNLLLPKQSITGDTNGTGLQIGDVAATERLYTAIHVFTAGTTADVIVESDDNSGFTSATTRSTTTVTAVGGSWVTPVAGAIADTHWRVRTANVTGTFSIAVSVGIA